MQLEEFPQSDYENQIQETRKKVITQPHEICIERAKLVTESYKTTKGEHPIIRYAKAMDHLLRNMTIIIWDNEFIVGNRSTKFVGTPLYPEVRVDTIEQDINSFETRIAQKLLISEEDKVYLRDVIIPYWKNEDETVQERFHSYLKPDEKDIMEKIVYTVDVEMSSGIGHFFPGHENILKFGLNGIISHAEKKLNETSDAQSQVFLKSLIIVYKAAQDFIHRFSKLAKNMVEKESNLDRQHELREISEICRNISENPPNSFKEAIQLIYFTHLICGLEDGGFAISIGRLDQYLYPYYVKDLNNGIISIGEVKHILDCFILKIPTLWNYVIMKGIEAAEGPPIAANLTIGGLDRDGNEATNDLSYLILESYTKLKTVQPTFSVRVHEKTREEFLLKVAESVKTNTSIALFNDQLMIKGLVNRGFTLEDAREYAPIGCVEPQHPYKSFASTNSNQFNIVKCLELALTSGTDMFSRRSYGVNTGEINSYEDLWNALMEQMEYFIKYMVSTMDALDKAIAELNPQPFLSGTIGDCIERGLDITKGGAIYDFTGPQLIGLATAADSLAVIKKYVFEEKQLPFEDLVQMLRKNYRGEYQGKKGTVWREIFLNKAPKFGNDDDYVDQIAIDVAQAYCDEIVKYKNYRGGSFNPGIYSTSFHLAFGIFTGASADGRKLRDPLSNGVGPTNNQDKKGPTAIMNSTAKLKADLMTNGNSLILAFHPNSFKIENFPGLIRSFFSPDGGYHIQFNIIGKDTLMDAQQNPDKYPGLVVRIAGYTVLFHELTIRAQNDIINRTVY
jgi:pyruvate formate-lyase/glycerol dehydratase family glycyl radical enzyme